MPKLPELLGTLATQFQIGIGGSGLRRLRFRNGFSGDLEWNPTADRVLTLPDSSGTIARLSDITSSGVAAYPLVAVTANKTLALTDNLTYQNCTNASAITITIPAATFSDNAEIVVARNGAGTVSIAVATNVTLNGAATTVGITARYKSIVLRRLSANTWVFHGAAV